MEQGLEPPLRFARLSAEVDRLSEELRGRIEHDRHDRRSLFAALIDAHFLLVLSIFRMMIDLARLGKLDVPELGGDSIGVKTVGAASGEARPRAPASPDGAGVSFSGLGGAGKIPNGSVTCVDTAMQKADAAEDRIAEGSRPSAGEFIATSGFLQRAWRDWGDPPRPVPDFFETGCGACVGLSKMLR